MKRRDLLTAGTAVAGAGFATSAAAQTIPPVPRTSPSVFDFGAKGDNNTDDSAAHILMHGCVGGFTIAGGNAAPWQAVNCSGPSPLGNLPIKGTKASA